MALCNFLLFYVFPVNIDLQQFEQNIESINLTGVTELVENIGTAPSTKLNENRKRLAWEGSTVETWGEVQ